MTSGDLFVSLVAGLAVPLAILDGARSVLQGGLPVQADGLQWERRLVPWLLALLAGPALMFDRTVEGWRQGSYTRLDTAASAVITAAWALAYGFVLLRIVESLMP